MSTDEESALEKVKRLLQHVMVHLEGGESLGIKMARYKARQLAKHEIREGLDVLENWELSYAALEADLAHIEKERDFYMEQYHRTKKEAPTKEMEHNQSIAIIWEELNDIWDELNDLHECLLAEPPAEDPNLDDIPPVEPRPCRCGKEPVVWVVVGGRGELNWVCPDCHMVYGNWKPIWLRECLEFPDEKEG